MKGTAGVWGRFRCAVANSKKCFTQRRLEDAKEFGKSRNIHEDIFTGPLNESEPVRFGVEGKPGPAEWSGGGGVALE